MEYSKGQLIRLIDMLILAPALIIIANKSKIGSFDRTVLLFTGIATFGYNFINYQRNKNANIKIGFESIENPTRRS